MGHKPDFVHFSRTSTQSTLCQNSGGDSYTIHLSPHYAYRLEVDTSGDAKRPALSVRDSQGQSLKTIVDCAARNTCGPIYDGSADSGLQIESTFGLIPERWVLLPLQAGRHTIALTHDSTNDATTDYSLLITIDPRPRLPLEKKINLTALASHAATTTGSLNGFWIPQPTGRRNYYSLINRSSASNFMFIALPPASALTYSTNSSLCSPQSYGSNEYGAFMHVFRDGGYGYTSWSFYISTTNDKPPISECSN